jgi:hypothetical protein
MTAPLNLVASDNLPNMVLALTDSITNKPLDVTGAVVTMKIRALGGVTVLSTVTGAALGDPTLGVVQFGFPGTVLALPSGLYEGEINLNYSGNSLTIFETQKFKLRARF